LHRPAVVVFGKVGEKTLSVENRLAMPLDSDEQPTQEKFWHFCRIGGYTPSPGDAVFWPISHCEAWRTEELSDKQKWQHVSVLVDRYLVAYLHAKRHCLYYATQQPAHEITPEFHKYPELRDNRQGHLPREKAHIVVALQ
jgi:hypothetical protein